MMRNSRSIVALQKHWHTRFLSTLRIPDPKHSVTTCRSKEDPSIGVSEVDLELSRSGCVAYKSVLARLGVERKKDIALLREEDLLNEKIPLVHARRILAMSQALPALGPGKELQNPSFAQTAMISLNDVGLTRGERSSSTILLSSVLGGCFLSFGASMFVMIGGGAPLFQETLPGLHSVTAALIFPIGLSSIVLSGSDLLTSNMLYGTLPFASSDQRRTFEQKTVNVSRLWALSFAGNFVGCATMAYCTSSLFSNAPFAAFVTGIALKKTSVAFIPAMVKAIGANWMVCLAVYQAATAQTTPGKMAALWLPVATFVALGLEHSVANMYFIPLGWFCGAQVGLYDFLVTNMIPVCIGNAIGAGVFVGAAHWRFIMGKQ